MKQIIKKWLAVVLWAGFIFFLSHQPDLGFGLPRLWDVFLAKSAHFLEYAFLTFFLIQALKEHQLTKKKILILAIVLAIGYALADEYHQSFILGRNASLMDVAIDSLGVLSMTWLAKRKMVK